jgi:hypothetical protein
MTSEELLKKFTQERLGARPYNGVKNAQQLQIDALLNRIEAAVKNNSVNLDNARNDFGYLCACYNDGGDSLDDYMQFIDNQYSK